MMFDANFSSMSSLEEVEKLAKPFESCSLKPYWDCAGYPTNGWGNLLVHKTRKTIMAENNWTVAEANAWLARTYPEISQGEADYRYTRNMSKALASVYGLVKVQLSIFKIAALTDMAFNAGAGNLQASTLLRMVNREDFVGAADEFLKWNKSGGVVYRGLTRRCNARKALFVSG